MSIGDIFKKSAEGLTGGVFEGVSNIISRFKADPTKVIEMEADFQKLKAETRQKTLEVGVQMEEAYSKQLETVNQTMREEGKSEHWMQWAWRPTVGFTFCAILINNYILVPYLKNSGAEVIEIPDTVFTAILVILGAASAGRGLTKWQREKN